MVVAWHHWRKVSRLEDREDYVRPLAWSRALAAEPGSVVEPDEGPRRRRSPPPWTPWPSSTVTQRRVLLLSHLTSLPLEGISREVGISRADGRAGAADRDRAVRGPPRGRVDRHPPGARGAPARRSTRCAGRGPRSSRGPGSARRRSHTTFGAAAAVAALVVSGSVVTDASGSGPASTPRACSRATSPRRPATTRPDPDVQQLTPEALLTADQVGGAARPATWTQGKTSGNTDGDGLVFTCQGGRYADPAGLAALVRTFKPQAADDPATAGQSVEVSADEDAGRTTYRTTAGWYAGCASPRMQLLATHAGQGRRRRGDAVRPARLERPDQGPGGRRRPQRRGDHHDLAHAEPARRPGRGGRVPRCSRARSTALCGLPAGGGCADAPQLKAVPPMADGLVPGAAQRGRPAAGHEGDPAVGGHRARRRRSPTSPPPGATRRTSPARLQSRTRPARSSSRAPTCPPEFGLTQTVGALPLKQAEAFVADVRQKLASCPDRDLATQVDEVQTMSEGDRELTVWRLTVEVSDERTVHVPDGHPPQRHGRLAADVRPGRRRRHGRRAVHRARDARPGPARPTRQAEGVALPRKSVRAVQP